MTAAGERRRRAQPAALALLSAAALLAIAACTPGAASVDPGPARASSAIADDDEQAITRTIERFNAAAAGPVVSQQTVLADLVDPALIGALDRCPPATATLRFEPIYPALRPAPGWVPRQGALGGTIYALPTLIRIYTGDRITGTDLTTLHLGVHDGEAYLTSLCLG
jgi:hypothetical protein